MERHQGNALFGDGIPAAGATVIYTIGVGDIQVACGETPAAFTVVDPDQLYKSPGRGARQRGLARRARRAARTTPRVRPE